MISFRLGSIPVRIHFSVLLVIVLFRMDETRMDFMAMWVVVAIASILIHELGHALVAMLFGQRPAIDLYGMGGVTTFRMSETMSDWKHMLVSFAGPMVGLTTGAIVALVGNTPDHRVWDWHVDTRQNAFLSYAFFANFIWATLNLIPMLPLDGGNILRSFLNMITGRRGEKLARVISILVSGGLALSLALLSFRVYFFICLLCTMFAVQNIRALRTPGAPPMSDEALREELKKAYAALESFNGEAVLAAAQTVARSATSPAIFAEAVQLVGYAHLLLGNVADADAAIRQMPEGFVADSAYARLRERVLAGEPISTLRNEP